MRLRKKDYWKFNADLLFNESFCNKIKYLIQKITKDATFSSHVNRWEYLKFKIREFSINYSKMLAKVKRQDECNIIHQINKYCSKEVLSEEDKIHMLILQTKLDGIYIRKAEGAYIRSRARWIEEGEKSTAYFYRLEKRRQTKNARLSLILDDTEISDPKLISNEIFKFYKDLYSSNFSQTDCNLFFEKIQQIIPNIDDEFKKLCDEDLQIEEIDLAMKKLKLNKSPGPDGLTSNFYRFFWDDLKELLFRAFLQSIEEGTLSSTQRQGLITLLPKPDKDSRYIDNLRPITLLNTDYKIFAHIFANRLKKGINKIINESQSGFLAGRSIHNNIRLIIDLLEYSEWIEEDGFILFLDFKKAFDMLEHSFFISCSTVFWFWRQICEHYKDDLQGYK